MSRFWSASLRILRIPMKSIPQISRRNKVIHELHNTLYGSPQRNIKDKYTFVNLEPSFTRRLNQAARQNDHYRNSQTGNWADFSGFALNKSGGQTLARRLGVNVPAIYGTWNSLDQIDWDELPDSFVLKANSGSSSRGVLPMVREGANWRVPSSTKKGTLEELLAPVVDQLKTGNIKAPFHAEQILTKEDNNSLANDLKVYSFYGQPAMIRVIERHDFFGGRSTSKGTFFDVNAKVVSNVVDDLVPPEPNLPPKNFEKILEVASLISMHTRLPHLRVDLYEFEDEVYFGELTPRCGVRRITSFGQPWDKYLGELWEHAEARIRNDLAVGNINPGGPVERSGSTPIPEQLLTPPTQS